MGNGAYDRFDEDLLGPLVPELKVVGSVNAGYSEFDLEWFNNNKIFVTNTIDAVAEPTADITIFLMLATLRDTSRFEAEIRNGGWRGGAKLPLLDPNGKSLGIIGMGKIGRVSPNWIRRCFVRHTADMLRSCSTLLVSRRSSA
jgi:lactate dehydrogenase-like 2-hydroxyacid dehydrogenase